MSTPIAICSTVAAGGCVLIRSHPPSIVPPAPPRQDVIEVRSSPPWMPPPYEEYTVMKGDTLTSIVKKTGGKDSVKAIAERNDLKSPNSIHEGQVLMIRMAD